MRKLLGPLKRILKEDVQSSWKIVYTKFKPGQEGLREALCALGNGYFVTRGAAAEIPASKIHYQGTYLAGLYNKVSTRIAGRVIYNEDLVNCPNWLCITFRIGKEEWINPFANKILFYRQELDMRRGILSRKMRIKDRRGRQTTIETQRVAHMANSHCAAIRYIIIPHNYEGMITVKSALDGTVRNSGVERYRQLNPQHLKLVCLGSFSKRGIYLSVETTQSRITISQAARLEIFGAGQEIKPDGKTLIESEKKICQEFDVSVKKKVPLEIEKVVSIYTSRDRGIENSLDTAIKSVRRQPRCRDLLKLHIQAWEGLWDKFDIIIDGDSFSQKVLRLHTFHLIQTASIHNPGVDAGLPARGLHGEAYRGHIFWDSIFTMPFFDFHIPQVSKALLLYRYRRLAQARKAASAKGYKGAMFPWQSGSSGEEETQVIHLNPMSGKWGPDYSYNQRHVSFAVAYNVWQYWQRTGDLKFMRHYGAEMLLSIAQFGASLAEYDVKDKRYHVKEVMGPDEFHERLPQAREAGFKDNAYTNLLIVYFLLKAREIIKILPEDDKKNLVKKLKITSADLSRWEDITRKMKLVINKDGIISQFDGYFSLKELDWDVYRKKYGNIQRLDRILKAQGLSPDKYKISKQADVLMIFYLFPLPEIKYLFLRLGYNFDMEMLRRNYEYYVRRTSHGSTLSKVVHCYIAHLIRGMKEWRQWFLEVLKSDIYDTQGGTTQEGIHMGVMGGSIDIVFRRFAGIDILDRHIRIAPCLPADWRGMKLRFCYRGKEFRVSITKSQISLFIRKLSPHSERFLRPKYLTELAVPVEIYGKLYYFSFGREHKLSLRKDLETAAVMKNIV